MPTRTNWSRLNREARLRNWTATHPSVRTRHPRQLASIPLHARLFADGRHEEALAAAVAAYHRNRRTPGTVPVR